MPTAELNPLAPAKPPGPATRAHGFSSPPDAILVRRTREGDERSFEAIFKRHHTPLLSYCRHMLGNRDEGEDALQQAFIKAHRALLSGSEPRELRPWLYAIARNCCLTAIAARRPTAQLEDRTPALAGLSEDLHRREDLRELLAGIGRLPEDQRSALLLAELEDLPHQAIATIVGCEVSKVKALIYQARSSLIADRDAREASCRDIREQLSVARGGELRRGPLRRHLKLCVGCRDFQLAVSTQRESLAAVLPVLPSAGLLAAILGHGAAHGAAAAGLGGTGGLASAGGTGAGAMAAGTGGAGGLTTAGTTAGTAIGAGTAAGTGTTAGVGVAVSAGAGAGGTSVGALVGGGFVTKLAIGGAVVAIAAAGAVTTRNREASTTSHRAIVVRSTAAEAVERSERSDILSASTDSSSSFAQGSPTALELASATGSAGSAGAQSLTELTVLGGEDPLLSTAGTLAPSAVPAAVGQLTGTPSQGEDRTASGSRTIQATRAKETRAKRRAALRRRRELLRRQAARLRRLRAARRRARRRALHRKPPPVKSTVKPPVAPAPTATRPPRRKAHRSPTLTTGTTAPNGSTTMEENTKAGASKEHVRSRGATGTGTASTGTGTTTGTTSTGTRKTGTKTTTSKEEAGETSPVKTKETSPVNTKETTKETGSVKTKETGSGKAPGSGSSEEAEGTAAGSPAKTKTSDGAMASRASATTLLKRP